MIFLSNLKKRLKLPSGVKTIDIENVVVRKAEEKDIDGIFYVASSVGTKEKDPLQGYLMDDYESDPESYKDKLKKAIRVSRHFYVAEYLDEEHRTIVGFTFGYDKETWLRENPSWIDDNYFRPDFDLSHLDNFIVLDKIAVLSRLKRQGIGGLLSRRLTSDIKKEGIYDIFEEVIIAPVPNLPSVLFKKKRRFFLSSVRYERHEGKTLTTLVYHRELKKDPR